MLYDNVAATFYSEGADDMTSKYYIYPNGTIRAKVANNTLRVRPGKNMMFVTEDDGETLLDNDVASVAEGDGNALTITLDDENHTTINASKVSSEALNSPVDMLLSNDGDYEGGLHVGHTIVADFSGGDSGISEADCNAAIAPYVNEENTSITAEENVTVDIVAEESGEDSDEGGN